MGIRGSEQEVKGGGGLLDRLMKILQAMLGCVPEISLKILTALHLYPLPRGERVGWGAKTASELSINRIGLEPSSI
jgi:hypothetical protein